MALKSTMTVARWLYRELTVMTLASAAMILAGCGSGSSTPQAGGGSPPGNASSPAATQSSQAPVSAEHNPPGDIPDTTIYVPYKSATAHATIKVPEGWARQDTATGSTFASNLNSISIAAVPLTSAPTVSTIQATTVPSLSRSALAFRLQSVRAVTLAGGPAVEIIYQVNSPPNAVTGRQYRLVVERFEFFKSGRGAALSLSCAVGSDNVDPWRIVSESFRWA